MPYVEDYQLRFLALASIACANLTIATANRLAIESRPAPTTHIRFLTPHIDYKTAERIVNLTQTHPIIIHAADIASIAGVSIFITTALAVESHAVTTAIKPVRAPVPLDSDTNHDLGPYRARATAADATIDHLAYAPTTDATTLALAIELRAIHTDPKPIYTPSTPSPYTKHDLGPYRTRAVTADATINQLAHVPTTDATTIALAMESHAVHTDPKPIRAPATPAPNPDHDQCPHQSRVTTHCFQVLLVGPIGRHSSP